MSLGMAVVTAIVAATGAVVIWVAFDVTVPKKKQPLKPVLYLRDQSGQCYAYGEVERVVPNISRGALIALPCEQMP